MSAPSLFEVRLFGRPSFSYVGKPFAFSGPPRAVPLLGYLATRPGEPVLREMLAVLLWPDADDATARANLRRHFHLVVKALPPAAPATPWIVSTATTLTWNAEAIADVDVAEFERLSSGGGNANLEAAVGRYRGDYLDGFDDEWIVERRNRLQARQLANLDELVTRAVAANDLPRALVYAQMMLAADPWREDAIRHVMRLKFAIGDRAGALVAYERFARELRDEVGVEPMPETTAEYTRVVRGTQVSALVAEATPQIGAETPDSAAPFVGREIERRALDTALSRLMRGHGGTVFIGGEAGIGKTRLTEAFAERAETQGVVVFRGATAPRETMPYEGPAGILAQVVAQLPPDALDPIWLAALAPLVPALARHEPPLPELEPLEGERDRRRLFDAATRAIAAVAQRKPVALILEDLHWAGAASIALVASLVEDLADARVLILATYRDEEIERGHPLRETRRKLVALPHVQRMALGPLARAEIETLIAPFVAANERAALATRLAERTDGNPFFLTELVRDRREAGAAADDALPDTVRETILARLARLSERARGVAEFGSIVGRAFDVDLVRETAGWSEHDILAALDELIDRRVVRDLGASSSYAFVHQLIPATIESAMDPALARRRHRRVALALEELAGEERDAASLELALHFARGGEAERAAAYYLQAARRATAVFAHDDAASAATQALTLGSDSELRRDALFVREDAARATGDRERQRADLTELDGFRLDDATAFEVARRRVALAHVTNDRETEAAYVEILAARARALGQPRALAAADAAEGAYAQLATQYDRAFAKLEAARARFAELGDASSALDCMELLVITAQQSARFDVVDFMTAEAERMAATDDSPTILFKSSMVLVHGAGSRSNWNRVAAHAHSALSAAQRGGDALAVATALYYRGSAATWLFDIRHARADLNEAKSLLERIGNQAVLARVYSEIATLEMRTGRYAISIEASEKFIALSEAIGHVFGRAAGSVNLSYAASLALDFDRAAEAARRAIELADSIDSLRLRLEARANLAVAERGRGRAAQAVPFAEEAAAFARRRGVVVDLVDTLAELSETYRCAGRHADARRISEEVVTLIDGVESEIVHPQMAIWYASKAFAIADPARALELAHRAHALMRVRAAAIPDAESQANYLAVPYNRDILERVGESAARGETRAAL
jgi:DNA-binding SARP family transcriptional activator/tetratricopeptide (TPR) repeat protein